MESQYQRIEAHDHKVNRAAALFAIMRDECSELSKTAQFRTVRDEVGLSDRKLADAYNISTNYNLTKNEMKR